MARALGAAEFCLQASLSFRISSRGAATSRLRGSEGLVRAERGSVARSSVVAASPNELPTSVVQPATRPLQIAICKLAAHKHAIIKRRIIIRLQRAGMGNEPAWAMPI